MSPQHSTTDIAAGEPLPHEPESSARSRRALLSLLEDAQHVNAQLDRRLREDELLKTLGEELHACRATAQAHDAITRHLPALLQARSGAIYRSGAPGTPLQLAARFGTGNPMPESMRLAECGNGSGNDYCCLRLAAQGEEVGCLALHYDTPLHGELLAAEQRLVTAAAQHIALALANLDLSEKLRDQATHDPLTGLYNRRYIDVWLAQELHRAARYGRQLGAIMLDIDHFRHFNNQYGHQAGDLVLRELAGVARRNIRQSDVMARYGGEEFLVLLPESGPEGTWQRAESLRKAIAALRLEYDGSPIGPVTVSLGVASYPTQAGDAKELVRRADEAMYEAKRSGRNRTVASGTADANVSDGDQTPSGQ